MDLHEGRKGAVGNYLRPETGPSRFHRRIACLSSVGPTKWDSLELGSDSTNHKKTDTTEVDYHTPGCLVSGIDLGLFSEPAVTFTVLWLLISCGVVSTLRPVTELNNWLPHSVPRYLTRSSNGVSTPVAQGWWAEAKQARIVKART